MSVHWIVQAEIPLLEQSGDPAVLVHVDLLGGGHLGQAGHGTPRDKSRGGPAFQSNGRAEPAHFKVLPPAKRLYAALAAV